MKKTFLDAASWFTAVALLAISFSFDVAASEPTKDSSPSPDVSNAADVSTAAAPASIWRLREREDVAEIWNGVSVSFDFKVYNGAVYVAFYAADRSTTLAKEKIGTPGWEFKTLPTKIGWDSHNSIATAFDGDGRLHVVGNMHAVPLIYFRAKEPNDVASLERIPAMTGERESRETYPQFFRDKKGRLIYTYRDGGSGNGDQLWNAFDEKTQTWSRLLDAPLFDGETERNAYPTGPILGPDGYFHLAWVWRETPDCATNRDLSYARSADLVRWEKSNGEPLELPIKLSTGEIVAPIPVGGGLLNPLVRIGFDAEKRPILTYTKYDDAGRLQIWVARREKDDWRRSQATDWDFDWKFSGGGTIVSRLNFGAVSVADADRLALNWQTKDSEKADAKTSSGTIYLDKTTLRPVAAPSANATSGTKNVAKIPEYVPEDRRELDRIESDDPRLQKREAVLDVDGERWVFRWEAPVANRDRPLPDGAPKPTKLRVFKFEKTNVR